MILSASCGIELASGDCPYKPLLDGAIEIANAHARALRRAPAPAGADALGRDRDLDWAPRARRRREPAVDCVPVEANEPSLHPLHLRHDRELPRAWCATTAATLVALRWSMRERLRCRTPATSSGPPRTSAGSSATPTSSTRRSVPRLHDDPLRRQAGRHPRRRRLLARHRRSTESRRLLHGPHRLPRHQARGPRGGAACAITTCPAFGTLFLAGERADPRHRTSGQSASSWGRPVIDHWWQTETGWPIAANCLGIEPLPVRRGSPTRAVPGFDVRVLDDEGSELAARRDGRDLALKLPAAAGLSARPCGRTTAGFARVVPGALPRLLPDRRRRSPGRGRLPLGDERAPTTSSTSQGTASRRGRWRKCCPHTPTWPSAR